MDDALKLEPKKQYEPPVLKVYGTVRDLTKAVFFAHHHDGLNPPGAYGTAAK